LVYFYLYYYVIIYTYKMSVLKHANAVAAHHVHKSVAHLLERTFRIDKFLLEAVMGTGAVPVDPFSCPEPCGTLELAFDETTGLLSIDSYDLSCVAECEVCPCNPCGDRHCHRNHHSKCHEHGCNHSLGHFNHVHRHLGHLNHGHFDHGHNNHVYHSHTVCNHPLGHKHHHNDSYHHDPNICSNCSSISHHAGKSACGCNWGHDHGDGDCHGGGCGGCGGGGSGCSCPSSMKTTAKIITIDCPPGIRDTIKIIYLVNTSPLQEEDANGNIVDTKPVRIYLTNAGQPVRGPEFFLLAPGQLRFLIIRHGTIITIDN
jgi:hypothetical protein